MHYYVRCMHHPMHTMHHPMHIMHHPMHTMHHLMHNMHYSGHRRLTAAHPSACHAPCGTFAISRQHPWTTHLLTVGKKNIYQFEFILSIFLLASLTRFCRVYLLVYIPSGISNLHS